MLRKPFISSIEVKKMAEREEEECAVQVDGIMFRGLRPKEAEEKKDEYQDRPMKPVIVHPQSPRKE